MIRLKNNWTKYLHKLRVHEIDLIKDYLEQGFEKVLEIGAGDGFQSQILKNYCTELHCTDINEERLKFDENSGINYKICDAEKIDQYYDSNTFDLVYSSNVFEHLPNPASALKGIKKILKDGGVTIHIMPNPFFDVTIILFHYPHFILVRIERLINKILGNRGTMKKKINMDNNIKSEKRTNFLIRLFRLPRTHGTYNSFREEMKHFSKENWIKQFNKAGFEITRTIKGPVYSGYGFGLKPIRKMLEVIGFCSEYIYILKKKEEL